MSVRSDPNAPTSPPGRSRPLPAAAIGVWLLLPGGLLIALVLGLRPAGLWPTPAERWGLHAVVATQILTAALLAPRLFATVWALLAVLALGLALDIAAGVAASAPQAATFSAAAWVALWILGLWGVMRGTRQWDVRHRSRGRIRHAAWLLLLLLTTASGLWPYLAGEWGGMEGEVGIEMGPGGIPSTFLPLPGGLSMASTFLPWQGWIPPLLLNFIGFFLMFSAPNRPTPQEGNNFSTT